MSGEENKAVVRRYLDAISGKPKPPGVLDQYISDAILKEHIAGAEEGFPNYELIEDEILAEGNKIVLKATLRGTQKGVFMGIPATGKQIEAPIVLFYTMLDGKIADHWILVDTMTVLQQLGVLPEPEAQG